MSRLDPLRPLERAAAYLPGQADAASSGGCTVSLWPVASPTHDNAPEVSVSNDLISSDPEIMSCAACFRGTRVPVQHLFDYLEGNSSLDEFLEDFPSVSRELAIGTLEAAKIRLIVDAAPS